MKKLIYGCIIKLSSCSMWRKKVEEVKETAAQAVEQTKEVVAEVAEGTKEAVLWLPKELKKL